jgi:hypothetical protein
MRDTMTFRISEGEHGGISLSNRFIFLEVGYNTAPENNGNAVDMWNRAETLPELADQ